MLEVLNGTNDYLDDILSGTDIEIGTPMLLQQFKVGDISALVRLCVGSFTHFTPEQTGLPFFPGLPLPVILKEQRRYYTQIKILGVGDSPMISSLEEGFENRFFCSFGDDPEEALFNLAVVLRELILLMEEHRNYLVDTERVLFKIVEDAPPPVVVDLYKAERTAMLWGNETVTFEAAKRDICAIDGQRRIIELSVETHNPSTGHTSNQGRFYFGEGWEITPDTYNTALGLMKGSFHIFRNMAKNPSLNTFFEMGCV